MNDLLGVLLRFRQGRVAIVGDIEAMFHQVRMIESDRDFLRFLWWDGGDIQKPPNEYRMCVHLFGATSSPSCAGRALRQTAADYEKSFTDTISRRAIDIIRSSFYVDDCLASVENSESAIKLVSRLMEILAKGGFRLTKWLSNDRNVLDSIAESERAASVPVSLDELPTERTLGVSWCVEGDHFTFQTSLKGKPVTRRGLLSVTSSIYDPLGFAAPLVLIARSLLQQVCKRGAGWDEPLTEEESRQWNEWISYVSNLSEVRVPRWLRLDEAVDVQLHIFCDASERGYAAVAYLRTTLNDEISCQYVVGKARVTPLKSISIPRLELMAAVLAVTLDNTIRRELTYQLDRTTYWSDSTIVLSYIRNKDKRFKTFVANRISKIHSVSQPDQWRHVGTKENPADEGSRGTYSMGKWLTGPDFLIKDPSHWPVSRFDDLDLSKDPEAKKNLVQNVIQSHHVQVNNNNGQDDLLADLVSKCSQWTRLVRVLGWILRFRDNLKNK
ncbi:uncharacterized protein LOC117115524, partial [Anneissia japonica]|uniref:uncharacterized protein LOC117115524 n=1 Tax=Anneissia japonica TaxID=1529436 RepID=UPI001425AC9D